MANRTRYYLIAGKRYARIRFGDEEDDWGANDGPCGDCGALKGQYHKQECDVERCPCCGRQWITCGCEDQVGDDGTPTT